MKRELRLVERLSLKSIGLKDEQLVDELLDQLKSYSLLVDGVPKRMGSAKHLLTATPPGRTLSHKNVFAVMRGTEAIGLVDMIKDYPDAFVTFVGLLAIKESRRHLGLGRQSYELVERYARDQLTADTIRLAVVDTNPVAGFWRKMGFRETGEIKPYTGEAVSACAVLMQKAISMSPLLLSH